MPKPKPTETRSESERKVSARDQLVSAGPFNIFAERRFPGICVLLFAVVAAVFLPSLRNDFLYWYGDDPLYVIENFHVNSGVTLENLRWAFVSTDRSNWHPLTWISHMIDCQIYGLKPWGHHLTSVLLHAANVVLLFACLRRMTGAIGRSLALAVLFGLHPLRVESVVWVAERKDVLGTFFWMLTLWAYARYVGAENSKTERSTFNVQRSTFNYALALVFFACGLMSKGMQVTLPCVLLLLDFWPLQRVTSNEWRVARKQIGTIVLEKIPFVLLAFAVSALTFFTQKSWGFVQTLDAYPLDVRLENAVVSYGRYLGKMFWPVDLCSFYPHPGHWPTATVLIVGSLLVGITIFTLLKFRRHPYLATGWLWYLGTLVPVIGLVQVGGQSIADRYTYIPMIGILIICIWGVWELASRWRYPLIVFVSAILIFCVGIAERQIRFFKDGVTIWQHNVAVTGHGGLAGYALGLALNQQGRTEEAIVEMEEVLKLKPDWADAQCNLGNMFCKQGRFDEGIGHYHEALKINPGLTEAHHYLGLALAKKGLLDDAIAQFREAVTMSPSFAKAHDALGTALQVKGQLDEAIGEFEKAIKAGPDYARAYNNLGTALLQKGHREEAVANFQQALRIKPDYADARKNLEIASGAGEKK